ncbi:hypothetical protein [Lacrimispora sp.]|uniref:hypothetical protein n=1 Tax=Lacrimispora sp. TaxID=2719234 RepID=UPI0028968A8C|nr:hypothetical protein [Lacrimispora sp.]
MKYTQNLNMKIPEGGDPIDIVDITENFETLDIEINKKANTSGGDISDTTIKTVDAIATEFPVPSAGESSKTFLGKIRKFIQDFIAIKDTLLTLSKLVNNGQTTASGFALDARYGKTLADQITKLNTDLKYFSQNRILIGNSENIIVQCTRRGHVVDIVFKGSKPISFPAGGFAFFTLAEQFRPSDYKYINAYGFNMLIQIAPNGEVLTYQESVDKIIHGQCSYTVE